MPNQRVNVAVSLGGGVRFPAPGLATSLVTAPQVIVPGVAQLQPLGVSSAVVSVGTGTLVASTPHDISFTIPLTGFPSPVSLANNASGLVVGSVFLQTLPDSSDVLVGLPAVSLSFGVGNPTNAGTGAWGLTGGQPYQGGTLNVTVRVVSFSTVTNQVLSFVGQAILLGIPAAA